MGQELKIVVVDVFFNDYKKALKNKRNKYPIETINQVEEILKNLYPHLKNEIEIFGITQSDIENMVNDYKETPKIFEYRKMAKLSFRDLRRIFKFYIDYSF